jgi:hypothetical protein
MRNYNPAFLIGSGKNFSVNPSHHKIFLLSRIEFVTQKSDPNPQKKWDLALGLNQSKRVRRNVNNENGVIMHNSTPFKVVFKIFVTC